nr:reverse transcriptase domain-containing protein [Tanacetum cinerariifolium]
MRLQRIAKLALTYLSKIFECLGDDIDLHPNSNFTFISDRQKGWCGQAYKDLLWRAASASNVRDFKKCMLELKTMNPKAHEWLNKIRAEHWARSHFSEPTVGQDGSSGSGAGAVIGLTDAAGKGGSGDPGGLQLNELSELRDQAYENSMIYKERMKKLHDSKIKNRIFNIGDQVLLFNSRLKIFSGKLKTRWSGPFTITRVFPYGTIELSQPDGLNFKVNGHRVKHYFGGDIPSNVTPDHHTFPKDN